MPAPPSYQMLRESDPRVESFHSDVVAGTKTSFAVFAPKAGQGKLPVLLFQSGHGSNMASQTHFLERIAAQGFIVIAPDRSDDAACGPVGIVGFLSGCLCAANAVDGSAFKMALEFAKSPENKFRDRADMSKVAMGGFSMGAQEALAGQARFGAQAMLYISGSFMAPLANVLGWNPACYPCSGGSCFCCSDTPVSPCGQGEALRQSTAPSLILTCENDVVIAATHRQKEILGERATLVTLKESAIDLSAPVTRATTGWGPFLTLSCPGGPFHGIPRHFAIIEDAGNVASDITAAFLKQHLAGGKPLAASDKMLDGKLNTKAPTSICVPFPLFRSCFES